MVEMSFVAACGLSLSQHFILARRRGKGWGCRAIKLWHGVLTAGLFVDPFEIRGI